MPVYNFECPLCAYKEEKLVRKMDEKILCPKCYGAFLKQVWSIPAPAQWSCSKGSL